MKAESDSVLRERVRATLESLARLAALRGDLSVGIGAPATGWSIDMASGYISIDEQDLLGRSPEFLAAITLHECAHATLTRSHVIVPEQIHGNPVEFCLINSIEDGRIETWLGDWLPGSEPWLASTQRTLLAENSHHARGAAGSRAPLDFCMGILLMRHNIPAPFPLHPAAVAALGETGNDIRAYFDAFPRFDLVESHARDIIAEYGASPLPACFAPHDMGFCPSPLEMSVRLAQYRAWRILHDRVRPAYLRLVAIDPAASEALAFHQFMQRLRWDQNPRPANEDQREALRRFRAAQSRVRRHHGRRFRAGRNAGRAPEPGSGAAYARARSLHASVINSLSDSLLRLRRTHGRLKWSGGFRHGHEPDMRVAMEFAATGRNHDRLWRRRHAPHRIAPAIVLLADRSGSMEGERAAATFAATVILAETCRRAGLPLSVVAYNTRAAVLQQFGQDSAGRAAAGRLEAVQQVSGGTRIMPALEAADSLIRRSPWREHLVIVVADGEFDEGEREPFGRMLSRWNLSSTRAAGLGLGPQTQEIARWFPGAKADLAPSDLSAEVSRLVSSFISGLYRLPAAA